MHDSTAAVSNCVVVSNQNQGGAGILVDIEQQISHRISGTLVEVSGRLVGE
jgi:hypothetical protein